MQNNDLLYTGDMVQTDGEIGRVMAWRVSPQREYLVRFPDGREGWYTRAQLALLRKMVVEPRPGAR